MLIVSCCNEQGGIFAIDEQTFEVSRIYNAETRGIDIDKGVLYSAGRDSVRAHWIVVDENGPKLVEIKRAISDGDGRHGVKARNGRLYVVDAITDMVGVAGINGEDYYNNINLRNGNSPNGRCHVNDLFFVDDESFIYTSFSDEQTTSYHNGNGCVKKYSPGKPIETLKTNCLRPHTPIIKDGDLYYCDSGNDCVVCGDSEKLSLPAPGFIRGLHVTDEWIYAGLSKERHIEGSANCGVYRVDRSDHSRMIFIPLPSGEVYGICRLEG